MCAEKKAIYTFNVSGRDTDVPGLAYDVQGLTSEVPGLRPGQTRPNLSIATPSNRLFGLAGTDNWQEHTECSPIRTYSIMIFRYDNDLSIINERAIVWCSQNFNCFSIR